ncbi:hypothetical protein E2542_SST29960 [Spatholobus suberectus]|nr:hypothetical protein E2542_SST29960 [Spatholobus suberectus]
MSPVRVMTSVRRIHVVTSFYTAVAIMMSSTRVVRSEAEELREADFVSTDNSFVEVEYFVMGKWVSGLTGNVYGFLGGLTLVCSSACIYLVVKPSAFFAEFLLSSKLVFKDTWLLQVEFCLYTDFEFLFTMHAIGVMVSVVGVLAGNRSLRCVEVRWPLLAEIESTSLRKRGLLKLEKE